jgi:type I restriction enzyme S subunit
LSDLNGLPSGWELVNISDITLPFDTVQPKNKPEQEFQYIDIGSIDNESNLIVSPKVFLGKDAPSRARRLVKNGDVLFSTVRTYLKNIARVPAKLDGVLTSTGIAIIRPAQDIDSNFIFYRVLSEEFIRNISSSMDGTLYPAVRDSDVSSAQIAIPPANEQKRIAAKIDALMDRSRQAREYLESIPPLLEQFRRSVLAAAFRGDLTRDWREQNPDVEPASVLLERIKTEREKAEASQSRKLPKRPDISQIDNAELPQEWELALSYDLFSFVTSGSRGWAKYYSDNGAVFLRIGNLNRNTISLDFSNLQRVSPPEGSEGMRTRIQSGDILISITADIGMIGLVPPDITEAYINQHVALARPLTCFSREYLAWYLASYEGGFKQLKELQRGATKAGLGLDDIRSVWIPIPSLLEQKEIVRLIELFFKAADEIENIYRENLLQVDQLNQSILAKAFRGELVPQDPNDEPASVLLERIKAEREKLAATKKKTKRKRSK